MALDNALETLTAYVSAFGETPRDPKELVDYAKLNASGDGDATAFGYVEAKCVIDVYVKNLEKYRSAKSSVAEEEVSRSPALEEQMDDAAAVAHSITFSMNSTDTAGCVYKKLTVRADFVVLV